jgi:ABC-type transport system involved in cytochrome c biogenesis permease subunit
MNKIFLYLLFLTLAFSQSFSYKHIPIQENGRIKPLDSFARNQLLSFYGKTKLIIYEKDQQTKMPAIDWFFLLITQNESIKSIPVFMIGNPDVADALNLEWTDKHVYSFNQINGGMMFHDNPKIITSIIQKDKENLELIEKQILALYLKRNIFLELYNSASALLPIIQIEDSDIAQLLNVDNMAPLSLCQIKIKKNELYAKIDSQENPFYKNLTNKEIKGRINQLLIDKIHFKEDLYIRSDILKLFPNELQSSWMSPWEILESDINKSNIELITTLESLLKTYLNQNPLKINTFVQYKSIIENKSNINANLLIREVNYNESNLFLWSLIFYLLTLVYLVMIIMMNKFNKFYKKGSFLLLFIGFLYHLSGVIIRMTILKRPPVSTLYESIIFVGLIAVLLSLILEIIKKDNVSLFLGAIAGIILHYLSFGYAADGDTFGVLIAVLNSNFWLATHVTTITIGYGTTIVASLVGHLYLIRANLHPKKINELQIIYNNMIAMTFIALFFTLFGTILGGIWGDQSWGRFWGWDPKENGALLIVMWLLMLIHLRISGLVKAPGYALVLVLSNITVALAWFGVNLLSVGLHSYGFTDGAALNLLIFIILEICFGLLLFLRIKQKSIILF